MIKISEEYLHFAWKYGLFHKDNLEYFNEQIVISDPGEHNHYSGPDFFNARIKIGNTTWAGNVEIHVKASDWYRHGHDNDPVYDSIILHVVLENDCDIFRINKERIPVLEIKLINKHLDQYHRLILSKSEIHCLDKLKTLNKIFFRDWITKMTISRLQCKVNEVYKVLELNKNDWEQTFYHFLGRSFGFKINSIPFGMLVETVPLKVLLKYRNNPDTINAILFGQAGFLENVISGDPYYDALHREFRSIGKILPPRVLHDYSWQFMRSRPANFPTVRISQFASLVINKFPLFTKIIECNDISKMKEIFLLNSVKYWEDHKLFGKVSNKKNYKMGIESAILIIINAVLPVLFSYGKYRMRHELQDRVLRFLDELPPEKNKITNSWNQTDFVAESAFDTQGMIHLTNFYCKPIKCLECLIGCRIITEVTENPKQ